MKKRSTPSSTENRHFCWKDGKLFFTKEIERKILFVLTLLMLLAGICYRLELF